MTNIPPPCSEEIYAKGHMVMMTASIPSAKIEAWVKKVAEKSGQPVDWHYVGGRACVLALGDLSLVYGAVHELLPEHDELQRAEHEDCWGSSSLMDFKPCREIYGEGEINTAQTRARAINTGQIVSEDD